jgi:DNA invertase Pin-like site-specific DNA recombinase
VGDLQWASRIEYIDIDRAGDDATREDLLRLLRETQAGDMVLAWKQDRVGGKP